MSVTGEPDLSMLKPTTVDYLRKRAHDYALARLNPDPVRRYIAPFDLPSLQELLSRARGIGQHAVIEMNEAYALMACLNAFAYRAHRTVPNRS